MGNKQQLYTHTSAGHKLLADTRFCLMDWREASKNKLDLFLKIKKDLG